MPANRSSGNVSQRLECRGADTPTSLYGAGARIRDWRFFIQGLQVRAREEAALIAAQTEADKYGNGVTSEAQDIFFALSKTCASLWSNGFAESFHRWTGALCCLFHHDLREVRLAH